MIVFCNIDGVLNRLGLENRGEGTIDEDLVANLNKLASQSYRSPVEIVIHSSWDLSLDRIVTLFVKKGFTFPVTITDRTEVAGGIGVRQWLTQHKRIGDRFLILDDDVTGYDELWCRLVACDGRKGLTGAPFKEAQELYYRYKIVTENERNSAVTHLVDYCRWLAKNDSLPEEERQQRIGFHLDIVQRCLTAPNFLEAACLKEPPK